MDLVTVSTAYGTEDVTGEILGRASSRTRHHRHPSDRPPEPYQRCSACRWTELTLVRQTPEGYVVISEGLSVLEGEIPYNKVRRMPTALAMVDSMYFEDTRNPGAGAFLSVVGRRALLEAAQRDADVAEVLRGRGILA
jgi:hypothetical protein